MSKRIRKFLLVLGGAGTASFLTMVIVQVFMGGISNLPLILGRAFVIGFGLALFITLLPKDERKDYPWL